MKSLPVVGPGTNQPINQPKPNVKTPIRVSMGIFPRWTNEGLPRAPSSARSPQELNAMLLEFIKQHGMLGIVGKDEIAVYAEKIFSKADTDGSGGIDFPEFVELAISQ
eukprot:6013933-Pyramimonas_sp.AAC.1